MRLSRKRWWRVADLLSKFAGRRVAVIGDVMLDQFMIGRVDRISPEAPVPVVRFEREEFRLGGAANVAHNIAALGGRVTLVGLIGAMAAPLILRAALGRAGVDHGGLVTDRERPPPQGPRRDGAQPTGCAHRPRARRRRRRPE
jgi:D-beta-D-heptose 7-phosphate kinase/D-beta-D-heptose 1-phosphate adenosyltransferase